MLEIRSTEPEMLDGALQPQQVRQSLEFMTFVNMYFGGAAAVLSYFDKAHTPDAFTVLDVGTGAGDIPAALAQWAARRQKKIQITAIDLNPDCTAHAQERFASSGVHFLTHSAFDLEALGPFDYITSSMFFHHLSDAEIIRLLKIFHTQSRRGFLINDLERTTLHYWGASLLAAPSFQKVIWNDARLSVARGFQEADFLMYRDETKLSFRIERKPLFRIVMAR